MYYIAIGLIVLAVGIFAWGIKFHNGSEDYAIYSYTLCALVAACGGIILASIKAATDYFGA